LIECVWPVSRCGGVEDIMEVLWDMSAAMLLDAPFASGADRSVRAKLALISLGR